MVRYGGEQPYHSHSQYDMWHRCLKFFHQHLKDAKESTLNQVRPVSLGENERNCHVHEIDFDKKHLSKI